MAFVRFPAAQVSWSTPPEVFRSSKAVERGFCGECGTPLTYRRLDGSYISLTLNSMDAPTVEPEWAFHPEGRAPWLQALSELPELKMDAEPPEANIPPDRP